MIDYLMACVPLLLISFAAGWVGGIVWSETHLTGRDEE